MSVLITAWQLMRRLLHWWLACLGIASALGLAISVSAAPEIDIHEERQRIDLPPYVDVLEDPQGILSIEQVSSDDYATRFAPAPLTRLFFGYTRSVFWLRFTVNNALSHHKDLILEILPADIDLIEVYALDRSNLQLAEYKLSGSSVDFSVRDYNHPFYYFDLNVPANGSRVYFVRLESNKNVNAQLTLSSPSEHFFYSGMRDWWQGFLFGSLLLLALLHFIFYAASGFKGFLYCGLWLFSMIFIQGSWNGYFIQFVETSPELLDRQLMFSTYLSGIMGILFVRTYLETHRRTPVAHRVLTAFLVLAAMGIPCAWVLPPAWNALLSGLVSVPLTFFVFGLGIYSLLDGYEPARYFVLARSITTVTILVAIFSDQGLLPDAFTITYGLAIAFVIEGTIFLYAMHKTRAKKIADELASQRLANTGHSAAELPVSAFCHELRTPISGVLGMSELLLDTALSHQQRAQVESLQQSGKVMLEVVNKMSDLASMEKGELELHETSFEMMGLVEACVENARPLSEQRYIEMIYQVDDSVAGWWQGDKERLQQVINNLVNYAVRHLETGELLLVAKPASTHQVAFAVVSGRNTLFQEALPVSTYPGAVTGTSGDNLNLSIARRYIALMGGELSIGRRNDGGWHFSFEIPLQKQQRDITRDEHDGLLRGKVLMVVDDNDTYCKILQQQALRWGLEAFIATSGKEAMALLRSRANLNQSLDLLLVDYDMPGMNGVELVSRLLQERDSLRIDHVHVMILTGVSKMPAQQLAQLPQGIRILYKPLSGKSLKMALIEALQSPPRVKIL